MLEESIPAIWASMNSWFTPTVLFVVLNLMIGTIAVASGIGNPKQNPHQQNHQEQQQYQHPQLVRTPSVLQRLKSINLYRYRSEDINPFPPTITTSTTTATTIIQTPPPEPETHHTQFHETPQTEEEEEEDHESEEFEEPSLDEVFHRHIARSASDTKPSSGIMPKKLPTKMKKSASTKSAFSHFEEEQIVEQPITRPSTVRERKKTESDVQPFGDDEEVDARADDFINRFKQQLKLQRLNSIIRYKEMLNRG